jgi:hypothetical protein
LEVEALKGFRAWQGMALSEVPEQREQKPMVPSGGSERPASRKAPLLGHSRKFLLFPLWKLALVQREPEWKLPRQEAWPKKVQREEPLTQEHLEASAHL